MVKFRRRFGKLLLALILLLPALAACSRPATIDPSPTPDGIFEIDPLLSEYFHSMGGEELFGPPISPLITRDGMFCQYTANALLCQNPLETGRDRYFLWPIGRQLHSRISPSESQPAGNVEIAADFFPLYQNLGGPAVLGFPLGKPAYNQQQQRVEQIFERVGFYRPFSEPAGTAYLLPFGKYDCAEACSAYRIGPQFDLPTPSPNLQPASPFLELLDPYGGEKIFGTPLTEPYQTPAGELEQIFEKIVLFSSPAGPDPIYFRPITRLLNMQTMPPAPFDAGQGNVAFYEIGDGLGYHVPVIFQEYIALHGGYDLSGPPIADTLQHEEENIIRQCFENYCLDYDPQAAEGKQIQLALLGARYLEIANIAPETQPTPQPVEVDLILSEAQPQIPPHEPQRIYILVFEKGSQKGIAGITASVTLSVNQSPVQLITPPTDENGWANITVPPMPDIQNSMLVPYQVCLNLPVSQAVCRQDSYLIWETQ